MPLFTVILDFRGGTYISQVQAHTVDHAVLNWARQLEPSAVKYFGPARKRRLLEDLKDAQHREVFAPVPFSGLFNAWCTSIFAGGLVNIIKTDPSS